jgi:hypothetical protein
MKIQRQRMFLLALAGLLLLALPASAARKPARQGERQIGAVNLVPRSSMQWFLPLLFLDGEGNVTYTRVPVDGGSVGSFLSFLKEGELELEGACNGGQCAAGGTILNCPTSGGPTCSSIENCYCVCSGGGSHNECR